MTSTALVLIVAIVGAWATATTCSAVQGFKRLVIEAPVAARRGQAPWIDLMIVSTLPVAFLAFVALRAATEGAPVLVASVGALLACFSVISIAQLVLLRRDVTR